MTVESLCATIWADADFQTGFRTLEAAAASQAILKKEEGEKIGSARWQHLLRCASIFLSSDNEVFSEAGLRIVHGALQLGGTDQIREFAGSILAGSANRPTLELGIKKGLIPSDLIRRLPPALKLEAVAAELAATINFESKGQFVGNRFQRELWESLSEFDWVSASAPTSAGKSFLLERWIERLLDKTGNSTTFYIVPTRALIGQVEADLRAILSSLVAETLSITSLPLHFVPNKPHNIYIYTQERFHLSLLNQKLPSTADLIVVDEAHKIGGGRRGVLLQQVLELSTKRYPGAKFLFASPSTRNPEAMLRFAPPGKKLKAISNQIPTVNQNLVWVSQLDKKPREWRLDLLVDGAPKELGTISLENRPSRAQKLAFISYKVGGDEGGNVVYVNRAADAEHTADLISQHFKDQNDPDLDALSELCEKAIHPQFLLRKLVKKGVAFHYGNIPQLVRSEVERLFSKGSLKYLVCTSTLIEGMNLACRNVFLRNPKRGLKELMTPDDFWNLAGRAGRWGKEFQGNIFCIDPLNASDWVGGRAPSKKARHSIEIATTRAASDYAAFIEYVQSGAAENSRKDKFHEQLLSYFVFRRSTFGDIGDIASAGFSAEQMDELSAAIDAVIDDLAVPIEIVRRNPGINPYGISALYRHFKAYPAEKITDLLPDDSLSDKAAQSYVELFSRTTEFLGSSRLGSDLAAFGNALLVVNWMRGMPLGRLIDKQIKYEEKRGKRGGKPARSRAAIIRGTMERVETIARFEAPKYLHCYLDVLNHFLSEIDRSDLIADVQDIWVYLEFGVSKRTQLSLMALGLSRSSTMAIAEHIKDESLDEAEVYRWLKGSDLEDYDLAQLVKVEILNMLKKRASEFS